MGNKMSRDNLCIGLERDYEDIMPKTCQLFRKIIDNSYDLLNQEECMNLYDIFVSFISNEEYEDNAYITNTFLV